MKLIKKKESFAVAVVVVVFVLIVYMLNFLGECNVNKRACNQAQSIIGFWLFLFAKFWAEFSRRRWLIIFEISVDLIITLLGNIAIFLNLLLIFYF